ncbi:MAG TPA: hypothetical protein PLV24_04020, partial [Anaerolineaceae bacterium]|nr:hypothetical protein [Anaerolineaceae bacterium]
NKAQEVTAVPDETLPAVDVTQKPVITPNIYLLVYDAYVPNETMQAYGIDNRAQEQYLRDQGFVLYPHTYSIGADSVGTMSRVLNMSTSYGGEYRKGVSGDGVVQNALQELGYTTYGIFPTDYMFQGVGSSYDVFFPRIKGGRFGTWLPPSWWVNSGLNWDLPSNPTTSMLQPSRRSWGMFPASRFSCIRIPTSPTTARIREPAVLKKPACMPKGWSAPTGKCARTLN